MNILIGILGYILGFASCILFVRILVAKKRNDEIINKAKQIIAKEKQKQKFNKEHNLKETFLSKTKNKSKSILYWFNSSNNPLIVLFQLLDIIFIKFTKLVYEVSQPPP